MFVFRLEDKDGNGPFYGEQLCIKYLTYHKDPDEMLEEVNLTAFEFYRLTTEEGWLFGWKDEEHFKKFFKNNGYACCREVGFSLRIYNANAFVVFPDGQVMFERPKTH